MYLHIDPDLLYQYHLACEKERAKKSISGRLVDFENVSRPCLLFSFAAKTKATVTIALNLGGC